MAAKIRSNFKNALRVVGKEIAALLLHHSQTADTSLTQIMTGVSRCWQGERPNRSYQRASKKAQSQRTEQCGGRVKPKLNLNLPLSLQPVPIVKGFSIRMPLYGEAELRVLHDQPLNPSGCPQLLVRA